MRRALTALLTAATVLVGLVAAAPAANASATERSSAATVSPLVTAVGSDGDCAAVTAGEAELGGRPLRLSLAEDGAALVQPRLVPDGDVKGGRYMSGVVSLVVSPRG